MAMVEAWWYPGYGSGLRYPVGANSALLLVAAEWARWPDVLPSGPRWRPLALPDRFLFRCEPFFLRRPSWFLRERPHHRPRGQNRHPAEARHKSNLRIRCRLLVFRGFSLPADL